MKVVLIPLTIISIMVVAVVAFLVQSDQAMQFIAQKEPLQQNTTISPKNVSTKTEYTAPIYLTQTNEVRLKADSKYISAVSIRLVLDSLESNPSITLNSELTSENWQFPVNDIYQKDGKTFIDIAAVNISQQGYLVEGELRLFTLRFNGDAPSKESIQFDAEQTIVIQKNGEKLQL